MVKPLMTWTKQKRWQKRYKGKLYGVSPRQLGTPSTKDASVKAANEWWLRNKTEIDAQSVPEHPEHIRSYYEMAIRSHRFYAKWQQKYGSNELANKSLTHIERLEKALLTKHPPHPLKKWEEDPLWQDKMDETGFTLWTERIHQIVREERGEAKVPENMIRSHIEDYLNDRKADHDLGKITLGTFQTIMHRLNVFTNWTDADAPIEAINELTLKKFYAYLSEQIAAGNLSHSHASSVMANTKRFIRSRWELNLIELPRNLASKDLEIGVPIKKVKICSRDELLQLTNNAPERIKLFLLLMLNCGMTQKDVADLGQDDVDWQKGRIKRRRSKTDNTPSTPEVDYRLWDETLRLLKAHDSKNTPVLVNKHGGPLWTEKEQANGKYTKNDNIRTAYFRLLNDLGIPKAKRKSLKLIRKTAASKLEENEAFGRYAQYFLGHAARSVAERHYVQPSTEQFDKAVRWLGEQFGFKTKRKR